MSSFGSESYPPAITTLAESYDDEEDAYLEAWS